MILTLILGIVLCVGIAIFMEKIVPLKFNRIISLLFWVVIIFLSYTLYKSIVGPVEFNKIKVERYKKVIKNLKDIKAGELAYLEINRKFTASFDSLVRFIDTAEFAITERRDTSYADVEKNRAFGLDPQKGGYYIEEIIIDTLRFSSVKDSLYGNSDRYKTMMNIPVGEVDPAVFELNAGKIEIHGTIFSVFEARVNKDIILNDLNKDLVNQEKQIQSVDGVNGPYVKVGSMDDVDTSGNWPKLYDSAGNQ